MTLLLHLLGTFCMIVGFVVLLAGGMLFRMRQEDMGKTFMITTYMGGGEIPDKTWVRLLAAMHGNERLRRRWAWGLILGGVLLALSGAAIG